MKKIALLGTSQMLEIGRCLGLYFQIAEVEAQVVCAVDVLGGAGRDALVDVFANLCEADAVYTQHVSGESDPLATENLRRYVEVRVVPTLESPCSAPQVVQMRFRNPFCLDDLDLRFLELYLQGVSAAEAPERYHEKSLDYVSVLRDTEGQVERYRREYEDGACIFDYSAFYQGQVRDHGPGIYFTHCRPNNENLEWLTRSILFHAEVTSAFSLVQFPPLLGGTVPPPVGAGGTHYRLASREIGLGAAARIFYALYDVCERRWLVDTLLASAYYRHGKMT